MKENNRDGLNMLIFGATISIVCIGLSLGLLFFNNFNFSFDSINYIFYNISAIFVLFIIAFFGGILALIGIVLHLTRDINKELIW